MKLDKVYNIQTESSGLKLPQLMTKHTVRNNSLRNANLTPQSDFREATATSKETMTPKFQFTRNTKSTLRERYSQKNSPTSNYQSKQGLKSISKLETPLVHLKLKAFNPKSRDGPSFASTILKDSRRNTYEGKVEQQNLRL